MENVAVRTKRQVFKFNGIRYYSRPSGYFTCVPEQCGADARDRYLHRAVWRYHYGDIPKGTVVHHKDHDKANNDVENLELLHCGEHGSYHYCKRVEAGDPTIGKFVPAAVEAAKAWHRSEEGLAWHREHGKRVFGNRKKEPAVCVHCGKDYQADVQAKRRGFCSMACQSAARRASGVDDVERTCIICGATFVTNKYSKTKTCSKACSSESLRRTRARLRSDRGESA